MIGLYFLWRQALMFILAVIMLFAMLGGIIWALIEYTDITLGIIFFASLTNIIINYKKKKIIKNQFSPLIKNGNIDKMFEFYQSYDDERKKILIGLFKNTEDNDYINELLFYFDFILFTKGKEIHGSKEKIMIDLTEFHQALNSIRDEKIRKNNIINKLKENPYLRNKYKFRFMNTKENILCEPKIEKKFNISQKTESNIFSNAIEFDELD